MVAINSIISILPFAAAVLAVPAPAPALAALPDNLVFNTSIATHTFDASAVENRAVAIDNEGRSRIIFCNDANRQGQCLNWGQKGHCWDFRDKQLAPWNDAISSVYPQESGVVWTLWEHYDCKGQGLDVWGNVDNLRNAAIDFNDKTSAFSWRLR
ncbi:hypothetical protein QBC34DRAFT_58845 [Podospora aff. communis PSN243]|uniref:Ecp2 effector protein domain-containing protein n=1 Tax=Podospora aff. communis PSN243 TaxID=3040156 RepID=A0AAV9GT50_9PEZI|nr:hypothetical protein QBC34DRAFT_58845 [Podospora aff. communis PSN243]